MSTATQHTQTPGSAPGSVFERVIVGIDGTEPGLEALRQALRLVEPTGGVQLVSAVYLAGAALAGWSAARIADELEAEAGAGLREAEALARGRVAAKLVNGPAAAVLRREVERGHATLLALGTHGHSRASEIVLGGVAGELLHEAPCSVLIARAPRHDEGFPRSLVVGVDGSSCSEAAFEVAAHLQVRLGVPLRVVAAVHAEQVDLERVRERFPGVEAVAARPVAALVEASEQADLVVVGSRGLHGVRALGSVGERVAHRARSSVLVVRSPAV